jgi:Tetratricopeptide repeat
MEFTMKTKVALKHHAKVATRGMGRLNAWLPVLGVALLLFCCPQSASAQKKKSPDHNSPSSQTSAATVAFLNAKALFEQGEAFFRLGEYQSALNKYREAYLISQAPLLLLNIAQCYRYLGQYDEAKHNYEAFVREDPKSPYRQEMQDKILEMETILEAKQREMSKMPAYLVTKEEPKRVKTWMIGTGIGVVLGGLMLTVLLYHETPSPQTDLGGSALGF